MQEKQYVELLNKITHDLKSPLASIKACVILIKNSKEAKKREVRRYLSKIDKKATDLAVLVDDITLYLRMKEGVEPILYEFFDICEVIDSIRQQRINKSGKNIKIEPENIGIIEIVADKEKIKKVLTILLSERKIHHAIAVKIIKERSSVRIGFSYKSMRKKGNQNTKEILESLLAKEIIKKHGGELSTKKESGLTNVTCSLTLRPRRAV